MVSRCQPHPPAALTGCSYMQIRLASPVLLGDPGALTWADGVQRGSAEAVRVLCLPSAFVVGFASAH
jgi:hypothetical protein